jgi:hypothetical protein
LTLPSTIILPFHPESVIQNMDQVQTYMKEMTVALQDMYEDIALNVNGGIKSDTQVQRDQWTPTLNGTAVAGTFTYTNRTGWVLRKGLITDIWFDVTWTASGGATGNLFLELPYQVALSAGKPFVGVCQSSTLAYTAGTNIVINAIPNTFRGEFWNYGSGVVTVNQAVVAAGQLIGYVRYIGNQNEQ